MHGFINQIHIRYEIPPVLFSVMDACQCQLFTLNFD